MRDSLRAVFVEWRFFGRGDGLGFLAPSPSRVHVKLRPMSEWRA